MKYLSKNTIFGRVSVQGVKSLGGHFACLCRGIEFYEVKFLYSEKATKLSIRNLHLNFDYSTYSQKLCEDFAKFCGLLRIYEL